MEEDADTRTRFSSLCYINDHVGFRGTIKNSPRDFVVIEINEKGQLVDKALDEPLHQVNSILPKPKNIAKKTKLDLQSVSFEEGHNPALDAVTRYSESDQSLQHDLENEDTGHARTLRCEEEKNDVFNSLLDEKTNELLAQFACDVKEKLNSKTELTGPSPELSLGKILDKSQRASLHSAIRQNFPFLITVGKNGEIVVKANLEYKELCHLVSEEEAFGFFKYLDAKRENSKFTFKPDTNKAHRKAVHHFLNKKFGNLVETKSFSELNYNAADPNVVITVKFREKAHKHRKRSLLDCQERKVLYTGLKDKKAITYQAMVVRKVTPERLKNIEKEIEEKRMKVFNIRSVDDPLRLGQLKGNHFDIVIRNLAQQINDSGQLKERILEAIENVKSKGFVNYYGPQRFGKGRKVHTDQIGLALLKSEMVKAVKLFLTPEDLDDPVNRAKRYFLQTGDAKGTHSLMPDFRIRERAVLESLHRFGVTEEGCIQAWFSFPHSMRIFYVHAYSSKIWNEAVSYRLATYGSRVVEGDLVCLDGDVDDAPFPNSRVHLVTEEEESANIYTINQVVLPVLGYNIQYPRNKVGQWYHELLGRDGLQSCKFRVPALKLNAPGCYRQILKYPHNLSSQLIEESDTSVPTEGSCISGATLSLVISFDLDSSCYATVCLREIMKHDV
ncbi:pseudouridylate synthase 7 homolog-like protein [Echinops telfairi]|uniref:Pseudouridylate synthase 7 homolog-like protein n=1 Tax=Echinops telfairi TaxID=9371 RepID=A0ABM0IZN2_ECHTE|nr:pseudouridylate synthase 7 homolog-like protein [Echinops telfairi]